MLQSRDIVRVFRHGHMACGIGAGARGFNRANPRVGNAAARFECAGGIDVDPGAIRNFERMTGVKGTVMDLFDRGQYGDFHGHEPPPGWSEAVPADIRAVFGRLDVCFASYPCLPENGPVVTETGVRPISTICPGDKVLTHRGRYRNVARLNVRPYHGAMFGFRLNGSVDVQEYTAEHPLWVRRVHRPAPAKRRRLRDAQWIAASDVRIGDRIGFPLQPEKVGTARRFVREVLGSSSPWETIAEKPELWFLLGVYLGDGYRARGGGRIWQARYCVGASDGSLADRVRSALNAIGIPFREDRSAGERNVKIEARSEALGRLCGAFGDGAANKQLPEAIFEIEDECARALIEGYRCADGSERGRPPGGNGNVLQAQWKIVSISLQLLRDVQRLMLRFGVFGGIHVAWPGGRQTIMGRAVNTSPRWKYSVRTDPTKRTTFEFDHGVVWIRVRSIARRDTSELVYNIEVDEDDTYCSPLIATHNCKGFSGLLSNAVSGTAKYQALNALTLRGMWLTLEAYRDDPIPILLFENVPRIMTRGRWLLDQITALLRGYGYHVTEDTHDCGEIGWLAQSRKRYLLIARHPDKVPPFIYQPTKHPLRGVGEVIGKLPLPGDPAGGPMHRVPALQWRTWVRLAFVKAGHDWRSLNDLAVEDGFLRDYGIVPDTDLRPNAYGVARWSDATGLITSARSPGQGRFSVADPRPQSTREGSGFLGVNLWRGPTGVISTRGLPTNGAYSIADPRPAYGASTHRHVLGVRDWNQATGVLSCTPKPSSGAYGVADPRPGYKPGAHHNLLAVAAYAGTAGTIGGATHPAGGAASVADPRQLSGNLTYQQYGVRPWRDSAGTVTSQSLPGGGPHSVADPRIHGRPRFNNVYRVVSFRKDAPAIAGPGGPAGGLCVADPRAPEGRHVNGKYRVTGFSMSANAVIGASSTGMGAFVVADPRCTWGANSHRNKLKVVGMESRAPTVTGSDRVGSGAISIADPRPACLSRPERDTYLTQGHYGVVSWSGAAGAIPAFAKNNNGRWSLADPRVDTPTGMPRPANDRALPPPDERLVARIIALDGTWHRPFTTLELAALQALFDPEDIFVFNPALDTYVRRWEQSWATRGFDLEAGSDSTRREWIGNAVPSASAQKMAEEIGEALLLASMGETFTLSSKEIWVKPFALALAVNPDQAAFQLDMGQAA